MLLDALGLETGSLQIKCPAAEIAECAVRWMEKDRAG